MKPKTLIIMAAGIGSRYGGLKQMDPVGPSGELIIDYSIYDAIRAGFDRIVFVISNEIEAQFKERIGNHIGRYIPVEYVNQCVDDLPDSYSPPAGRLKPWGTGHAVYCCRKLIDGPFAVVNADDFYGFDVFSMICDFLGASQANSIACSSANARINTSENPNACVNTSVCLNKTHDNEKYHCCMAGYRIENTLTENGHVARGVCRLSDNGYLAGITEYTHVESRDGAAVFTEDNKHFKTIEPGTVVSMNMWGFPAEIIREFDPSFRRFLSRKDVDLLKTEYFLPFVVNELLIRDNADVKVLHTDAKWYGITYREDKDPLKNVIAEMIRAGDYPERLWDISL